QVFSPARVAQPVLTGCDFRAGRVDGTGSRDLGALVLMLCAVGLENVRAECALSESPDSGRGVLLMSRQSSPQCEHVLASEPSDRARGLKRTSKAGNDPQTFVR